MQIQIQIQISPQYNRCSLSKCLPFTQLSCVFIHNVLRHPVQTDRQTPGSKIPSEIGRQRARLILIIIDHREKENTKSRIVFNFQLIKIVWYRIIATFPALEELWTPWVCCLVVCVIKADVDNVSGAMSVQWSQEVSVQWTDGHRPVRTVPVGLLTADNVSACCYSRRPSTQSISLPASLTYCYWLHVDYLLPDLLTDWLAQYCRLTGSSRPTWLLQWRGQFMQHRWRLFLYRTV